MAGTRTQKQRTPPTRWSVKETNDAVQALKDGLTAVGVTFPSLDREHSALDSPLVDLGRCRPDVAQDLAACLVELVELRGKVAAKEGADASV
ncbi:hypothetical protein [Streptomyces sp. NPDC002758]